MTTEFEKKAFDMLSGMGADLDAIACDEDPEKLYEYLNECLDIEFRCSSAKEYKSAKLYVTLGGPTVWIDTDSGDMLLSWGSAHCGYGLDAYTIERIDCYCADWFNA